LDINILKQEKVFNNAVLVKANGTILFLVYKTGSLSRVVVDG